MQTYLCTAREYRQKGAIGAFQHNLTEHVEAETPYAAIMRLYDKYDHIHGLKVDGVPAFEISKDGSTK